MSSKFLHTTGRYSKFLAHYTVSACFYLCRTHALYILTLALRTISCQFDEIKCPTYQYCCDLLNVVFTVIIRALSLGIYACLPAEPSFAQPSEYGVNRQMAKISTVKNAIFLPSAVKWASQAQVICERSKENVNAVFRYFMTSTRPQRTKLTINFLAFPSVNFSKISQTGGKNFTVVGARFSGKFIRLVFLTAVKHINL